MEIELKGIDDLKDVVNRLGLFAKTMSMAADKIDDALTAHIAAMDMHAERLEALNGLQNRGTDSPAETSGSGIRA